MPHRSKTSGFSLVELLATIAVMAAVIAIAMFFVAGYVQWAQFESDHQTYFVLNDALNRYKGGGGNVSALTLGAPPGDVLTALETPVTWGAGVGNSGISHQFLATGYTYPARSLQASGNGATYVFYQVGTYNNGKTPGPGVPTSKYPLGQGVAYVSNGGSGSYTFTMTTSTTGHIAFKDASGNLYYNTGSAANVPATAYVTFWSCKSGTDPTPSGAITGIYCGSCGITTIDYSNGLTSLNWLSAGDTSIQYINLTGCTGLTSVPTIGDSLYSPSTIILKNCSNMAGSLTFQSGSSVVSNRTIDLTNCSSLTSITIPEDTYSLTLTGCTSLATIATPNAGQMMYMTSLNCTGLTSLSSLFIAPAGGPLSSINLTGCNALSYFKVCAAPSLSSLDLSNKPLLTTVYAYGAGSYIEGLTSLNLNNCPSLSDVQVYGGSLSASALNTIYAALPTASGTIKCDANPGYSTSTTSIATAKNWIVN